MITLSIYDVRIAPAPRFEYYTAEEIVKHKAAGFTVGCISTSYDQFPKAHCVTLDEYNEAIEEELSDED